MNDFPWYLAGTSYFGRDKDRDRKLANDVIFFGEWGGGEGDSTVMNVQEIPERPLQIVPGNTFSEANLVGAATAGEKISKGSSWMEFQKVRREIIQE